jgi:predicted Zn finger-like uncharacterized protein
MRLKCPNCAAEYDVAASMIPPEGRHVQCTACHTRWFVHPPQLPDPAEDRIIERLEAWSSRPRPVAVADPPSSRMPEAAVHLAEDDDPDAGENFVWDDPEEKPEAEPPATVDPAVTEPEPVSGPEAAEVSAAPVEIAATSPGIPQPQDVPDQTGTPAAEVTSPPEPGNPPAPTTPSGKPALRLDLSVDPNAAPEQPRPQSRFAKGLAIALAVFVLALAVYNFHDLIVARVPQAAPAIGAYVQVVDDLRQHVADQVAGFIDDRP